MKRKIIAATLYAFAVLTYQSCAFADNECEDKDTFDFVVVGAGTTGSVLANRLSEDGKFSVCVLEAGRDDARLPELLPEQSAANVPQPGDFHWGQYTRGDGNIAFILSNRGFGSWWFYQNTARPNGIRSTSYVRYAGFGGCSSHNATTALRNPPFNWNQWSALGLNEWNGGTPPLFADSPLIPFYKKFENRSQALFGTAVPIFNPNLPPGSVGGFDPVYYGFDGMVPLFDVPPSPFATNVIQPILNTTLSQFGYPTIAHDSDYPPTADQGGIISAKITAAFQNLGATITRPGEAPAPGDFTNNVPFAQYNPYGDTGFKVPEEFQQLNNPALDPAALQNLQRASSANTYLYDAQNAHQNLNIISEVLVTNLIMEGKKARGVEFLRGWNIYQAGRNPNTEQAGYGGRVGDARFNGIAAKNCGKRKVFAKKAVVLSAGVYNTPQILQLSGIGDEFDIKPLGIPVVHHLPGVGKHLIDDLELFIHWQLPAETPPPGVAFISAFANPGDPAPTFDVAISGGLLGFDQNLETDDPFVQKSWTGLRNLPGVNNTNTRNIFTNILLDPTNPNANPGPITITDVVSVVPPFPPNTGPWLVTFTIPSSIVSAGGFTVSGNSNPNYNGTFTAYFFNGNPPGNNVPGVTSITLAYPSDPGAFGTGTTTILGQPAFLPIMRSPTSTMGIFIEQQEHVRSEGFVRIQSADPTVPPLIVMKYLGDTQGPNGTSLDLQDWKNLMMQQIFPIMEALQAQGFLANLLWPAPYDILKPGETTFSVANVDDSPGGRLETFLKSYVGGHHAMGTCKMGLANDPLAVVDQHGAVHGIKNLYIADISVVPVSIHWPNSTCYVIGEKIASDILAKYSCKGGSKNNKNS